VTTLSDGTTTITLPDLLWQDEFAWQAPVQSAEYSITGALLLQSAARLKGRPITLASGAWMVRSMVEQLRTWANTPGQALTLAALQGSDYSVRFDHARGALQAQLVHEWVDPDPADNYTVTLRFLEV
jgi:hypothetical protein